MGRVYKLYSPKWVFLVGIIVFEIGSAISGAAPTSTAFIVGRAISGLGSASIMIGMITILFLTVPLQKRPIFQGFFGASFGIASVVGPLLGGVFTDDLTWRWCFYINLPVGGFAAAVIFFILHLSDTKSTASQMSWREQIGQLDPIGNACLLPGTICLLLALQWGGSTYQWQNARIIVLFVLFGFLILGFVAVQLWKQEKATVPPRIVKMRSIAAGMLFTIFNGGSMMVMTYFIPLWFQAIKGVSAVKSGIMTIPMILSLVIGSILSGVLISKLGYYTPFAIVGAIFISIGAGLISTFTVHSGHSMWIGYQFLFGLGLGMGMMQPNNALQTVLGNEDIAIGVSVMSFIRFFGGTIFISVAENVFTNKLISNLSDIPGLDSTTIANAGALNIRKDVSVENLPAVLVGYNDALRDTFYFGTALSCMSLIGALLLEWRSVKKGGKKASESTEA